MDILLYNNASEPNEINKALTLKDTITSAIIKGSLSYESPVFTLVYDGTVSHDINYMYVQELGRYYFITDIINLTGGRYEIRGKVDVLESFKSAVLGLLAIIDKANGVSDINTFLDDGSFVCENKEFNSVINFPSGFNDAGEYILITAGGGGGII